MTRCHIEVWAVSDGAEIIGIYSCRINAQKIVDVKPDTWFAKQFELDAKGEDDAANNQSCNCTCASDIPGDAG